MQCFKGAPQGTTPKLHRANLVRHPFKDLMSTCGKAYHTPGTVDRRCLREQHPTCETFTRIRPATTTQQDTEHWEREDNCQYSVLSKHRSLKCT